MWYNATANKHCARTAPLPLQVIQVDTTLGGIVATLPTYHNGTTFGFPWVYGGFHLEVDLGDIPESTTVTRTLSLRFAQPEPSDTPSPNRGRELLGLANDTLAAYRARFPISVGWPDRRPIGALFPSDCGASCHCKTLSPADCPNPRGYNFAKAGGQDGINVTSPEGVAQFKVSLLAYVNRSVNYCVDFMGDGRGGPAGCQGIMVWSLEGQQYPQTISWVGDPRELPTLAPEMDAAADDMFKLITGAGLQCGLTLRPQQWTQNEHWNASLSPMQRPFRYRQQTLLRPDNTSDVDAVASMLIDKAGYAYKRWGCRMFYVVSRLFPFPPSRSQSNDFASKNPHLTFPQPVQDTTVCDPCPTHTLPAEVWFKVHQALPNCVFFPEESTFAYRSVVAPLQDNWGGAAMGTPYPADLLYGRDAWSFELMQFTPGGGSAGPTPSPPYDNATLLEAYAQLVRRGDALLYNTWYNASENLFVKKVYELANQTNHAALQKVPTSGAAFVDVPDEIATNGTGEICTVPIEIADEPIDLAAEVARWQRSPSEKVTVLWSGHGVTQPHTTARRCVQRRTPVAAAGKTGLVKVTIHVSVPWNLLGRHRGSARLPARWAQAVAACSDGLDNDGDGMTDLADPGCRGSMAGLSEAGEPSKPPAIQLAFGSDPTGGAYIASLTWKGKTVVKDDGTQGNRYFLHGDLKKFTSDIEVYSAGIEPWLPNTSNWKTANAPTFSAAYGDPATDGKVWSNVTFSDGETTIITTTSPFMTLVDTVRVDGDAVYISTNVSSKVDGPVGLYFPVLLGNLQLGTTAGCDCAGPLTVHSGAAPADGHGEAGNCSSSCTTKLFHLDRLRHGAIQQGQPWDNISPGTTIPDPSVLPGWRTMPARGNSYPSSSYSPVTALGGVGSDDFTVGMQVLSQEITPDRLHDATVEFYDIPAAPKHPLLSQYMYLSVPGPNATRSFTTVLQFGQPGASWEDPSAAVAAVLTPYAEFFKGAYGTTPAYCPSGAIVMRFAETTHFNRTTHTYVFTSGCGASVCACVSGW